MRLYVKLVRNKKMHLLTFLLFIIEKQQEG